MTDKYKGWGNYMTCGKIAKADQQIIDLAKELADKHRVKIVTLDSATRMIEVDGELSDMFDFSDEFSETLAKNGWDVE